MTIKRKLPGEGISIFGTSSETEPPAPISELEFSQLISRIREDNPELSDAFIEDIVHSLGEAEAGKLLEYFFD